MIVVDTSVWVEYFRGRPGSASINLDQLLDQEQVAMAAPVRIELIAGAGRQDGVRLRRVLSALPHWLPTDATWATMETWVLFASLRGQHFGVGDLLIGAIAAERGVTIWSLDDDFERLARLGLVTLHR